MTHPDIFSPSPQEAQTEHELERHLTDFFQIINPDFSYLSMRLPSDAKETSLDEHPFPATRIKTTSDKKWELLHPIFKKAGVAAIRDTETRDEEFIHAFLRRDSTPSFEEYTSNVALLKQAGDLLLSPAVTLDTVTTLNGIPLEKPHTREEAIQLITQVNGKTITTTTTWYLEMKRRQSGYLHVADTTSLSYTLKHLSEAEIIHEVMTSPTVLKVPVGLDLATPLARHTFIDTHHPGILYTHGGFKKEKYLTVGGERIGSGAFTPIFSGVPTHALEAALPWIKKIYTHGETYFFEEPRSLRASYY